ncbi:phosphatidylcholine transfer protein, putative [Entamoeba invadens IP1]|uniref:Phosphatidylcholine transfer protein, putative n=1 Tax=Entamoeba invadens IP1 TaxID=370355 RepID=A0A0A1UE18_ENTIV|nr:phosphatidylcholine transfer protein, putative [Entamoeba invadens IP1]ELP91045.1 phosphatidylcholine transfer protein, putative [Entamoeba invadens IP1]|eukprot:XP_004257816.1 phosphatidylcholine transfer protein, putative [Entamoeba invadens IP1]
MSDSQKESPITKEEFETFRKICVESNNWKEYTRENNTVCYQGVEVKSGYFCMKAVTDLFVNYPTTQIFDFLNDEEFRDQWDSLLLKREKLRQIDDSNQIIHYFTTLPMVANRDYVYYKSLWMSDDKDEFIIMNKSIELPDCPATSDYVRAQCEMSGYMVKKNDKGEGIFYYYTYNAFGGWVPSWVMNSLISSQGLSLMKKLVAACEKYPEWKKTHNPESKPWNTLKDKIKLSQ